MTTYASPWQFSELDQGLSQHKLEASQYFVDVLHDNHWQEDQEIALRSVDRDDGCLMGGRDVACDIGRLEL